MFLSAWGPLPESNSIQKTKPQTTPRPLWYFSRSELSAISLVAPSMCNSLKKQLLQQTLLTASIQNLEGLESYPEQVSIPCHVFIFFWGGAGLGHPSFHPSAWPDLSARLPTSTDGKCVKSHLWLMESASEIDRGHSVLMGQWVWNREGRQAIERLSSSSSPLSAFEAAPGRDHG